MPREKSRYRDRRSVSYSSDSSYEKKKVRTKHKRRTRSRDRSQSSNKRRRSSSRSKHSRRSYTRSLSRDRYESKTRSKRSSSHSRHKRSKRSPSRNRSRSKSNSRSRSKQSKKSRRKSYSSRSRSSSPEIVKPQVPRKTDDSETKIEKAIKAAEAAGLTMTRLPSYEYKDVDIKEDMPTIQDRDLLAELNSDTFVQKTFTSSRSKKQTQNIVIDLSTETVTLPEADMKVEDEDTIINFDALPSEEEIKEMWIKKLYLYRKKMLKEEI